MTLDPDQMQKFRGALSAFYVGRDDFHIETLFNLCDRNSDGKIEAEELQTIMSQFYGEAVSVEEVQEMIAEADTNNDGVIELLEFFRVMRNHRDN